MLASDSSLVWLACTLDVPGDPDFFTVVCGGVRTLASKVVGQGSWGVDNRLSFSLFTTEQED